MPPLGPRLPSDLSVELAWIPVEEDAAAHEGDAAREPRHAVDVVGCQDDRDAQLAVQTGQQRVELPPRGRVHPARRLVEDQEVRIGHKALRDEHALRLSARQLADAAVPQVADIKEAQHFLRLLAVPSTQSLERLRPGRSAEQDRLEDRRGEIRIRGLRPLRDIPDAPQALRMDGLAEQADGPAGGLLEAEGQGGEDAPALRDQADAALGTAMGRQLVDPGAAERDASGPCRHQAGDRLQQRGLPGPVRPEESEEFLAGDAEIDAVDGADAAWVLDDDVVELDHGLSCIRHGSASDPVGKGHPTS